MSRTLSILAWPETGMGLLTLAVFALCSRFGSYSDSDVRVLEKLMWILPFVIVSLGFLTLFLSGARSWSWLVRSNLAVQLSLMICAWRIVSGFGAPGSGPKGQEAGFVVIVGFGFVAAAVVNTIYVTAFLRAQNTTVDAWYREHSVWGPVLTVLSFPPVVVTQGLLAGIVFGCAGLFSALLKR